MATNSTGHIPKTKTEMKKINVLIVDDDKVTRMLHEQIIKNIGGVSEMAENGEEAVNLHQGGAKFDLILMDKEMPVKDGVWATKKLREMRVRSKIIGVASVGEEEGFMGAGLDACLTKPLSESELLPIIYWMINE